MRLLEHQAKSLLSRFELGFNEWTTAADPTEALTAAKQMGFPVAIKAQVPVGGRAKAGAVKFAEDAEAARQSIMGLFGMKVGSHPVALVSIEHKLGFKREFYAGAAWDSVARVPVAILSNAGGVDVEAAPASGTARRPFDPRLGLRAFEGRIMAGALGLRGRALLQIGDVLSSLCRAFLECDAVVAEINPLVEAGGAGFVGLDAHVEIDDDALYRQQDRLALLGRLHSTAHGRAPTALEREAQRIDSMDHRGVAGRVVEFDGDLALLIGGGGASLTVFDAVRRHGGRPANYCEIGGNPTEEKVAALTSLLVSKPGVRRLAVIMNVVNNTRADVIARGVLDGLRAAGRDPAQTISIFRIPGSWEKEAAEIMAAAGVFVAGRECSLDEAARTAVMEARSYVT
jgi:succinyl-CoA synthetase beta subunit/citryl-CoA synthetase large subunit